MKTGLVILKNFLTEKDQKNICNIFLKIDKNMSVSSNRHRFYDSIKKYPDSIFLTETVNRCIRTANNFDKDILIDEPTHLILLKYQESSNMKFHKDISENDGDGLNPIVSFSIGNSCDFAIKYNICDTEEIIRLNSGDVILFGGKSRYIYHSVKSIYPYSGPVNITNIIGNHRLNLTFRHTPKMFGKEHKFKKFTLEDYLNQKK